MRPLYAKIVKIVEESPSTRTFRFDISLDEGLPGQFLMVWVHGVDEVPMTTSYKDGITVQKVGDATARLFEMSEGDHIGIRGPFGRGFTLPEENEHILIVAGGVGAAPLACLAEEVTCQVTTVLGARTEAELIQKERFEKAGEVHISTDDGSAGCCGFVTHVLADFDLEGYDRIYVCGPEMMMFNVLKMLESRGATGRSEFSLHRYFKCGIGVCGACCMDRTGLRVCRDGPVFGGTELVDSEFGKYMRDSSGKRVSF